MVKIYNTISLAKLCIHDLITILHCGMMSERWWPANGKQKRSYFY